MMTEFVHEDVRGPRAIGRDGAVQAEDPATTVRRAVGENLDDIVGGVTRNVAKRFVLVRQHVALRVERVVARPEGGAAIDSLRGPRDARLGRTWTQAPDVDVALP